MFAPFFCNQWQKFFGCPAFWGERLACWGKLQNKIQCCLATLVSESTGLVTDQSQNVALLLLLSVTSCVVRVARFGGGMEDSGQRCGETFCARLGYELDR